MIHRETLQFIVTLEVVKDFFFLVKKEKVLYDSKTLKHSRMMFK